MLQFVLGYPDEYIKSVEATYQKPNIFSNTVITSLKFETSKGRTSFFGYNVGKKFVLEQKGHRLVGFHGKEDAAIDAIGAYFGPVPTPTPLIPSKKLPAIGGNEGVTWDDGVYDGVRKILVGQGNDGVSLSSLSTVRAKNLYQEMTMGRRHYSELKRSPLKTTQDCFVSIHSLDYFHLSLSVLNLFSLCLKMVNIS